MPQFTHTKDFRSYLRILWRWKFLLLAFLIAAPVAAYLVERGKPNVYQIGGAPLIVVEKGPASEAHVEGTLGEAPAAADAIGLLSRWHSESDRPGPALFPLHQRRRLSPR